MPQISSEQIVDLVRLVGPTLQLRKDLEQAFHLETYDGGMGSIAVQTVRGLLAAIRGIAEAPCLGSLTIDPAPDASDKIKVAMAYLVSGQILAYLASAAGIGTLESGNTSISVQRGVIDSNVSGIRVGSDFAERLVGEITGSPLEEAPEE